MQNPQEMKLEELSPEQAAFVSDSPDPENRSAQEEIEGSWNESVAHIWSGEVLAPYSSQRQSAAFILGLQYGRMNESQISALRTTGMYSEMMQDSIIVIFVCSAGRETLRRVFNPSKVEDVREEMYAWADAQGIYAGSDALSKACALAFTIIREVMVNRFEPKLKAGGKTPGN